MSKIQNDFGSFTLERLPKTSKGDLRAWDAADELILNTLNAEHVAQLKQAEPLLIINDAFGALAVSLHDYVIHSWSDSLLSQQACENNFKINGLKENSRFIPSTEKLPQHYKLVLIKIPKTLTLLEDQLIRLKPHITNETRLLQEL